MYYLICKLDSEDHARVLKEPFETEEQAISRACALLTSGEAFTCVLEDDNGAIADDAEVAERCASL